jgi:hypothetical protein
MQTPDMAPDPMMKRDDLEASASFFEALFDFTFSKYISVTVVRVLYVLAIILALFGALAMIVTAFAASFWSGLFALVFAPLLFVFYVLISRVMFEIFVVIFRIADYLREIAENTKRE